MKKIGTRLALVVGLALQIGCSSASEEPSTPPGNPGDPETPPKPAETSSDPMAPAPRPGPGNAMIRAIHASADAPAVDVYAKGSDKPLLTNLGYGQTSKWLEVPKGTYELELRAAPSTPTDPIAYKTSPLAVVEGAMVSAVAVGLVGSTDSQAAFRIVPLVDEFGLVPAGKIRVRALHGGADAPIVDLDVGNDNPGAPEVKALARFADTGKEGVALPADEALAIGIAKDGARVTSFTTPKLPSGGQVLVVATGLLAKLGRQRDGFALLAVGPSGSVGFIKQDPIVYALHASPDAPAVDAFAGETELFDNLPFGALSQPIQVKPGSYTLDFYGTTSGSARPKSAPAASGSTGELSAGERYLAIANGFLGKGNFKLLGYKEAFDTVSGKAVLRAVHGSPDAPAVDIGLVQGGQIGTVLFRDLSFTKASAENGLAADEGHLPIGVSASGSASPVATFTVPAQKDQRAFVVAAGALAPASGQQGFRLAVVDTAQSPWTVTHVFPH